jgi:ligand-binding sensor domain-containing protein
MSKLYPFDPFSAKSANWEDAQNDVDFIEWGYSQYGIAGENLDISPYSIQGDWSISLNNISHKDGRKMYPTLSMQDDDGNKWFGTTEGYILKGWRHSSRLELLTIGMPFDHITTAYNDQNGNWWFADSRFKRTGQSSSFKGIFQTKHTPFIIQWHEADNQWTYYTPEESILIENTDVNVILRVGSTMYFGTMFGLLYLDLYTQEWNLINETKGLNDTAVWDLIEHDGSIYVATARGINEISIVNHSIIPDRVNRYEPLITFNIYDMEADSEFIYLATDAGLFKMGWENGKLTILSKRDFQKIKLQDNSIAGTDGSLFLIE